MHDFEQLLQQIGLGGAFAAICGLAGYLHRQVSAKQKITLIEGLVRSFGSAVAGVLVMMACMASGIDVLWSGVIVGASGWLGADMSVALVEKIIKRKLGL